jgi:Ca2+-binding RTX toxin-like protein
MATNYDDIIIGDAFNNYLEGFGGDDNLSGNAGSDALVGGSGNDDLIGYGGTSYEYDYLIGGTGADLFVLGSSLYGDYYLGDGYATIADFYWQEGDYISVGNDISQYSLDQSTDLLGSSAIDTAIYKGNDLIAVVQDTTDVIASRDFLPG